MEDINLNLTGDFYAITTANNLLCAMIDNHIYHGNELNINKETICIKRILDMNDRALRNIQIGIEKKKNVSVRNDGFEITAASEVMAIFCLAEDINDLNSKLGEIIIGYNYENKPVYAKDIKANNAMTAILKDAILPNLVQTIENTPCMIHGGPFANIAHGCNSVVATKLSMKLCDYTVTEAGFGADLGAEKFLDIKCRKAGIMPDVIVLTTTVRALKYNGLVEKEELKNENLDALEKGICNLEKHIDNLKLYKIPVIVAINEFYTDTEKEIEYIKKFVNNKNIECVVSKAFEKGSKGSIELAEKVVELTKIQNNEFKFLYDNKSSTNEKINCLVSKIYGGSSVKYTQESLRKIEIIKELGKDKLPICMAKTQVSFSDDSKLLGAPKDYEFNITDIKLCNGAGYIIVYAGNILTMPGLPKKPAAESIGIDNKGSIYGIF